jgi:tetratricopeptide (TPR) repeat protein
LKLFRAAYDLKPKNAAVNASLGLTMAELGAPDAGIVYLKNSILLDPMSVKYRLNLSRIYAQQNLFREALNVAVEALLSSNFRSSDQLHHLWNIRGLMESNLGLFQQALSSFREALTNSGPTGPNSDILHNCAKLLLKTNQSAEAVPLFQRLNELEPDNPETLCNLAIALTGCRNYTNALEILDKGLKRWPKDPALWLQHGIALRGVQRLTRAAGSFTKAAEMDKQNELAWLMKGLTLGSRSCWIS